LKELTLQYVLSPIAGGRDRGKSIQFQLERVNRTLAERVIDAQLEKERKHISLYMVINTLSM